MIQKIRVRTHKGPDLRGEAILNDIKQLLQMDSITNVKTASVYRLDGISKKDAVSLAENLLCEKINQEYSINQPLISNATHVVEIAYKPGVMNPEVTTIKKAASDLGINLDEADSSKS